MAFAPGASRRECRCVCFAVEGYLEEGGALQDAGSAAHLPDGVHGELRSSDVDHGDAEPGGQDGSDGGSTRAVITHHHVLQEEGSEVIKND